MTTAQVLLQDHDCLPAELQSDPDPQSDIDVNYIESMVLDELNQDYCSNNMLYIYSMISDNQRGEPRFSLNQNEWV